MDKIPVMYDRPREKLQHKGAASLTNTELLQVLIGSGNGQASVGRIAKRTLRVLAKYGSESRYDQLLEVIGLGPALTCQIIAAFELASRYPMSSRQLIIDTNDKIIGLVPDVITSKYPLLAYITVDGVKRLISKRTVRIGESMHPSMILRKVFSDVVADNASGLMVIIGSADHALEPSMFELSFARDLKAMAQLFIVTVYENILINKVGQHSLRSESW